MDGSVQLAELADKVVGAEPRFDATGRRVAVALYRMLGDGAPVPVSRLAASLGLPEDAIRNALESWAVFYDRAGEAFILGRLTNTRNFGDALAAHVTDGG